VLFQAQKAWLNFYNEAAKRYREQTDRKSPIIGTDVRREAAKLKETEEYEEIKTGYYDDLISDIRGFKKYEGDWEKVKSKM